MSNRKEGSSAPMTSQVDERWWVDSERERGREKTKRGGQVGSRLFAIGKGYDQERARENLTDLNLKLLREADPACGAWSYLALTEGRCTEQRLGQVKGLLNLPDYARGLIVDSDGSLRVLVTGTPPGERIVEMTLGDEPSFDFWLNGEWIAEKLFKSEREAFEALSRSLGKYLLPEGLPGFNAPPTEICI